MMKNWRKMLAGLCACALLAGCAAPAGTQPKATAEKRDLVMAVGSEPEGGFDPCTGWGRYGSPLIQSTLVETDEDMGIVNDLAEKYTVSADGLTLTFTLRRDARFTDGTPVTAGDVAFTFQTAKASGSIVDLTSLERCEARGDQAIFHLTKPDSAFLYTVAATGIVPEHAYGEDYGENPVGSGPYKLVEWKRGEQVVLEANGDYYRGAPAIERVTILLMGEDAAFAAAKAGELDVAITTPALAEQSVPGMKLVSCQSIDNRGLTLPNQPGGETDGAGNPIGNDVTSDIAIRRALSYGLDREALVRDVLNGRGRPAYTECDGMPWGSEESAVDFERERAQRILDEAGWLPGADGVRSKDGVRAAFNLLYGAGDSTRQALSLAVAEQARELGIEITVEGVSWDEIDRRMYAEPVMMGWGAQNPNETYLLYHSDNAGRDYYNPENYRSSAVDQHIDEAMEATDWETAMAHWKLAQYDGTTGTATQGDCPWVWLVNVDHLYFVREGLDIGTQKIHPHGHDWPLAANLRDWRWK